MSKKIEVSKTELRRRLALKRRFVKNGVGRDDSMEAILRDLARIDSYPDDLNGGWLRVGLVDLYNDGIEVSLGSHNSVVYDERKKAWVVANHSEKGLAGELIARIHFGNIVSVDWDGDDYYREPHIYCEFSNNGTPYESFRFFLKGKKQRDEDFEEIKDFHF